MWFAVDARRWQLLRGGCALGKVVFHDFFSGDHQGPNHVVFDCLESGNVRAHSVDAGVVEAEVAFTLLFCLSYLVVCGFGLSWVLVHVGVVRLQRRAEARRWVKHLRRVALQDTLIVLPFKHLKPSLALQYSLLSLHLIKLLQGFLGEVYL